ncbi:MAG: hypothetical protein WCQ48_09365 [Chloroflexota bacterium]
MSTAARDTALHALVSVERLLRRADPAAVPDLLEVRAAFESTAGRTVTRGRAARLLALSQTSVDRWIVDGAIPTVTDVDGRTMVPTRELIRLRVEMDEERRRGIQRPLGVVVRRRREAAASLPLDEIAPSLLRAEIASPGHRRAEVIDLVMHRLLARELSERDLEVARWQLDQSETTGLMDRVWAERWRVLLGQTIDAVRGDLVADTAAAARLRQSSPFKGLLRYEDRRALLVALGSAT